MSETKDILVRARELISNPKSWTKRAHARDGQGRSVSIDSSLARSFCLEGAIKRASQSTVMTKSTLLRIVVTSNFGHRDYILSWNDHPSRTHAEVLAVLDKAIAVSS